jgi:5-formyltetrahydrofolate cyclo-ligase
VWDTLEREKLARFPFPPHGRIANFAGAAIAAQRLFTLQVFGAAKRLKVNPDSPQLHVRLEALRRGISLYVPTPRLRAGFNLLDPAEIPQDAYRQAASLSGMKHWSREVSLSEMRPVDAIVTGCSAVTVGGKRCGKGEGYSDIEYAILRELGQPPVPVATTVHDVQVVEDFPTESNDLPLDYIVTPTRIIEVDSPPPAPDRIHWELLSDDDLEAMPILKALRAR